MTTGEVISLPTRVPLARAPGNGLVISAKRSCEATWALFREDGAAARTRLLVLGAQPNDGGLAGWSEISLPATVAPLSTARLQSTPLDLLLVTEAGEALSLQPRLDGGCPTP